MSLVESAEDEYRRENDYVDTGFLDKQNYHY